MPLKGLVLKSIYPETYLREMSDADILIKDSQYKDKIVPLMKSLGYVFSDTKSEHDYKWVKDGYMVVELHKFLFDSDYTEYI